MHHPDLDAYFARVGWSGDRAPTWPTLRSLHLAHVTSVPFENADVVLGGVPSLDPADLAVKLVDHGRGGHCFEQNLLFADVLRALGFEVTLLLGEVAPGVRSFAPGTHGMLAVRVPGEPDLRLADVGFGGGGPLEPLPLSPDAASPQGPWWFRLSAEAGVWRLLTRRNGDWEELYSFTAKPRDRADFTEANRVACRTPSPFTSELLVQRTGTHGRRVLRGRLLTAYHSDGSHIRTELKDDQEVLRVLATDFGLPLPWDTRFPGAPA